MSQAHYQGGCQCGAVRYAVDIDLDDTVATRNIAPVLRGKNHRP